MIADKVSLCVTLILLSRFHRDGSPQDLSAKAIYEASSKSIIDANGITPADFEKAFLRLAQHEARKPTVRMGRVHLSIA